MKKALNHRKKMRRQLGEHISGLVEGYAQATNCTQEIAELEVRHALRAIEKQMNVT